MKKMNFKYSMFLLLALGLGLWAGCDDKEEVGVENDLPPGTEYVKQGNQCLNVVYYIPKGEDTLAGWHRSVSGIVLEEQELFRKMMTACGYDGKTFQLCVNKQNPGYVKVSLVQGEVDSIADKGVKVLMEELEAYFALHPEEKMSSHTLVLAPDSKLNDFMRGLHSLYVCSLAFPAEGGTLPAYNQGWLANRLGYMFFLPYSAEPIQDVYYSLMNPAKFSYWNKNAVELKKPDAMWLDRHPLFNPQSQGYALAQPKLTVDKAEFEYAGGEIHVDCEFTCNEAVAGVVVINDPWTYTDRDDDIRDNNFTISESIPYAVEHLTRNGSKYTFTLSISWDDLPVTYKIPGDEQVVREAELRFRFILENGMTVPLMFLNKGDIKSGYRFPYVIRSCVPDFTMKVDVELKPDEEEPEGGQPGEGEGTEDEQQPNEE